jgi:molecular chaperone DnaJ
MADDAHDLYGLLGVSRDASAEEIKKAYRALARQLHPDAGGSREDEERFKQVSAAYEILSDPAKRQQYDMFGSRGGAPGVPFTDFGDIFDFFFGGAVGGRPRRRASRTQPGESLLAPMEMTLEEAAAGTSKEVEIEALVACERCGSSGCEPGTRPSSCRRCGGTGNVQEMARSIFGTVMTTTTCLVCEGTGEEIVERCADCAGAGRVMRRRVVTVDVPPGVSDGLQLRVAGAGNSGRAGGAPGDLHAQVQILPHVVFERRGNDLFTVAEIPFTQAALGVELEVGTLDGVERVRIEPGFQSGVTLRVRGKGMPVLGRRAHGDLFLTVRVRTPDDLGRDERRMVEGLAQARGEVAGKRAVSRPDLRRPTR